MIVDMLLRLLGENPAGYQSVSDKWGAIIGALLYYSESYLYLLFIIPWIWLFINKSRGRKITTKKLVLVMVISVFCGLIGYFLPWLIFSGLWGMMVTGIYGGQI